ncbi:phospholipase D-like domain-containing protein [Noviherbaspirillum sp.]|uniref:phospholipase D-like domain-containing protein n=1 Tax=Noviherbaspirillum sp. TaxID=1926288 RepID=UPI002FE1AA5A
MKINRLMITALLSIAATLLTAWLALNLSVGDKEIDTRLSRLYATDDAQFRRAMSHVLTPPMVPGNHVEALINGDHIFAAMLDKIRAAKSTITFETYIFWSGSIGKTFADALVERAKAGVKVHVMLDWIGGQIDDSFLRQMRDNGVQIRRYNAPHRTNLNVLNNRTHRKILVVDGTTGFIGGVGIADVWRGNAQNPDHWRDTHYRVTGPVVAQLQSAFIDNWLHTTGDVLHGAEYFPQLASTGTHLAHVFTSSPGGGSESMQLMYLMALTAAADSIRISASYFIPDDVAVKTLVAALDRGVKVQIILPGPYIDFEVVRWASRATWGKLLAAGAEIYEYQPTMYHVKTLIVDALWVSVGSTNFDNRSFSINDEANLNVYDPQFAQSQIADFDRDRTKSRLVTFEEWASRKWHQKLLDAAASLLSSQL